MDGSLKNGVEYVEADSITEAITSATRALLIRAEEEEYVHFAIYSANLLKVSEE